MKAPKVIVAFDSGVGGLSALAPLLRIPANLELYYYGDLAHLPYGGKTPAVIRQLVASGFADLLTHVKDQKKSPAVGILACNTASALATDVARGVAQNFGNFPVLGVIESGCASVLKGSGSRIVVLGTQATVQSQAYLQTLRELGARKSLLQKACPLFVPLVEENLLSGPATEWIVDHYLKDVLHEGDDVVLGCTHYPFLQPLLEKKFPGIKFYDAGNSLIENSVVTQLLSSLPSREPNKIHFMFSDESVSSSSLAQLLEKCSLDAIEWSRMKL